MKRTIQKSRGPLQPLQSGQIWRMVSSHMTIGIVGKSLVHYKLLKDGAKRSPNSLSGKVVVERFLKLHKATLVQE
ncbi:MAG: hypothetical protein EXS31_15885 [Pedosphaera sp.]|nr:hypothetical protein [Pedosphaera sp.]